jgi:hypothetical protein
VRPPQLAHETARSCLREVMSSLTKTFLRFIARADRLLAHLLTRCEQFASRTFGEAPRAHPREHVMRDVELLARVQATIHPPQPLP